MLTPIHKFRTAIRLSGEEWLLLLKSWLIMFYIRLRMNLTPFRSWKKWLLNNPIDHFDELTESDIHNIAITRRMIVLASRYHIIKANCLPKSLTLKWLLGKKNIYSELKMGISLDKANFQGHAWLAHGNMVLNDSPDVAKKYPVKQELSQEPIIT